LLVLPCATKVWFWVRGKYLRIVRGQMKSEIYTNYETATGANPRFVTLAIASDLYDVFAQRLNTACLPASLDQCCSRVRWNRVQVRVQKIWSRVRLKSRAVTWVLQHWFGHIKRSSTSGLVSTAGRKTTSICSQQVQHRPTQPPALSGSGMSTVQSAVADALSASGV